MFHDTLCKLSRAADVPPPHLEGNLSPKKLRDNVISLWYHWAFAVYVIDEREYLMPWCIRPSLFNDPSTVASRMQEARTQELECRSRRAHALKKERAVKFLSAHRKQVKKRKKIASLRRKSIPPLVNPRPSSAPSSSSHQHIKDHKHPTFVSRVHEVLPTLTAKFHSRSPREFNKDKALRVYKNHGVIHGVHPDFRQTGTFGVSRLVVLSLDSHVLTLKPFKVVLNSTLDPETLDTFIGLLLELIQHEKAVDCNFNIDVYATHLAIPTPPLTHCHGKVRASSIDYDVLQQLRQLITGLPLRRDRGQHRLHTHRLSCQRFLQTVTPTPPRVVTYVMASKRSGRNEVSRYRVLKEEPLPYKGPDSKTKKLQWHPVGAKLNLASETRCQEIITEHIKRRFRCGATPDLRYGDGILPFPRAPLLVNYLYGQFTNPLEKYVIQNCIPYIKYVAPASTATLDKLKNVDIGPDSHLLSDKPGPQPVDHEQEVYEVLPTLSCFSDHIYVFSQTTNSRLWRIHWNQLGTYARLRAIVNLVLSPRCQKQKLNQFQLENFCFYEFKRIHHHMEYFLSATMAYLTSPHQCSSPWAHQCSFPWTATDTDHYGMDSTDLLKILSCKTLGTFRDCLTWHRLMPYTVYALLRQQNYWFVDNGSPPSWNTPVEGPNKLNMWALSNGRIIPVNAERSATNRPQKVQRRDKMHHAPVPSATRRLDTDHMSQDSSIPDRKRRRLDLNEHFSFEYVQRKIKAGAESFQFRPCAHESQIPAALTYGGSIDPLKRYLNAHCIPSIRFLTPPPTTTVNEMLDVDCRSNSYALSQEPGLQPVGQEAELQDVFPTLQYATTHIYVFSQETDGLFWRIHWSRLGTYARLRAITNLVLSPRCQKRSLSQTQLEDFCFYEFQRVHYNKMGSLWSTMAHFLGPTGISWGNYTDSCCSMDDRLLSEILWKHPNLTSIRNYPNHPERQLLMHTWHRLVPYIVHSLLDQQGYLFMDLDPKPHLMMPVEGPEHDTYTKLSTSSKHPRKVTAPPLGTDSKPQDISTLFEHVQRKDQSWQRW